MNKKFYTPKNKLKSTLTEKDFDDWKEDWFKSVVGCKDFACVHDSMTCGIAYICGYCSIYGTYKNYYGKPNQTWCDPLDHFKQESENPDFYKKYGPLLACMECTGRMQTYHIADDNVNEYRSWCPKMNDYWEKTYPEARVNRRLERFKSSAARDLLASVPEAQVADFLEHKEVMFEKFFKKLDEKYDKEMP